MNEEQAMRAVANNPTRVTAYCGDGSVHGEGRVYAYSNVPVLYIETDSGHRFTWRHDMCKETEHGTA